jgi:hypothetical protein
MSLRLLANTRRLNFGCGPKLSRSPTSMLVARSALSNCASCEDTNTPLSIPDIDRCLTPHLHTDVSDGMIQCSFVYRFQKAVTKFSIDREECSDNLLGQVSVKKSTCHRFVHRFHALSCSRIHSKSRPLSPVINFWRGHTRLRSQITLAQYTSASLSD